MDLYFTYDKPVAPTFHRCKWCRGDLSGDTVCGTEIIGGDPSSVIRVHAWFCSKDCAREYYQAKIRNGEDLDELNRYIKEI